MRVPKITKRRLYDRKAYGTLYFEGDRDFTENNMDACVWFLENRDKINNMVKRLREIDSPNRKALQKENQRPHQ